MKLFCPNCYSDDFGPVELGIYKPDYDLGRLYCWNCSFQFDVAETEESIKELKEELKEMNIYNAAAIANDKTTTVVIELLNDKRDAYTGVKREARITKNLAEVLQLGELVIFTHDFTSYFTGMVSRIDAESEIEIEEKSISCWVVQRLEVDPLIETMQELERKLVEAHRVNERQKIRESIVADYFKPEQLKDLRPEAEVEAPPYARTVAQPESPKPFVPTSDIPF